MNISSSKLKRIRFDVCYLFFVYNYLFFKKRNKKIFFKEENNGINANHSSSASASNEADDDRIRHNDKNDSLLSFNGTSFLAKQQIENKNRIDGSRLVTNNEEEEEDADAGDDKKILDAKKSSVAVDSKYCLAGSLRIRHQMASFSSSLKLFLIDCNYDQLSFAICQLH